MCCSSHHVRPSSSDTQPSHSNESSVIPLKFQRIGRPSVCVPSCRIPSRWPLPPACRSRCRRRRTSSPARRRARGRRPARSCPWPRGPPGRMRSARPAHPAPLGRRACTRTSSRRRTRTTRRTPRRENGTRPSSCRRAGRRGASAAAAPACGPDATSARAKRLVAGLAHGWASRMRWSMGGALRWWSALPRSSRRRCGGS